MNVYISHARKDADLALRLAKRLEDMDLTVVHPQSDGMPGENWASELGKALQDAEFMVILLTPGAFERDVVRMDVEFALGAEKFDGRVFTVFVGPTKLAGKNVPWILLSLPH